MCHAGRCRGKDGDGRAERPGAPASELRGLCRRQEEVKKQSRLVRGLMAEHPHQKAVPPENRFPGTLFKIARHRQSPGHDRQTAAGLTGGHKEVE